MPVYCSNFYSFLQCRNFATHFGERCGFCTAHGRGRAMKEGLLTRRAPMWSPAMSPMAEDAEKEHESDDSWTNVDLGEGQSPDQRSRRAARARST